MENEFQTSQRHRDHVIFIHGVNTRQADYAQDLITKLSEQCHDHTLNCIPLYWGNVSEEQEAKLRVGYENSSTWKQFWFRDFREHVLLQFVGDAALYASRYVGQKVVAALREQLDAALRDNYNEERDVMHLVTHSLGTVILFDLLFSPRWNPEDVPGHDDVMQIRSYIYGLQPDPHNGLRLGSLHTMGSPIGLYNLLNVTDKNDRALVTSQNIPINSHDITLSLQDLLSQLTQDRENPEHCIPLPWLNFSHPGDPVASPLEGLLPDLLDGKTQYVTFTDKILHDSGLLEVLDVDFLHQSLLALIQGLSAHSSYWKSEMVVNDIATVIQNCHL